MNYVASSVASVASSIAGAPTSIAEAISSLKAPITASSSHLDNISVAVSTLMNLFADLIHEIHTPPSSDTGAEARKVKATIFLRDYFEPLPAAVPLPSDPVQDILPNNPTVKFREEIQHALGVVLHAAQCNISFI